MPDSHKPFADVWLTRQEVSGRLIDILELPDGALPVSDDRQGEL